MLTALVPVGAVAWLTVHRRARAAAARAALRVRTTSAFIDLDPRGIAPRAGARASELPMAPPAAWVPVVPLTPPAIAATTLAGRARAQIRVVATTTSPTRAGFPRRSSHLRLVPAVTVKPLDGHAAAGETAHDARTA